MLCYLSQAYVHSVLVCMVVVYGYSVAMMHAVNMLTYSYRPNRDQLCPEALCDLSCHCIHCVRDRSSGVQYQRARDL